MTVAKKSQRGLAPVLRHVSACGEAIKWAGRRRISRTSYDACPRGDWLLWLAGHVGVERKLIVLAACDCAELALPLVPKGEDWPRAALTAARAWCDGRATRDDLRAAASGAAGVIDRAAAAGTAIRAAVSALWAAIWAAESARAWVAETSWSVDAAVRTVVRTAEAAGAAADAAKAAGAAKTAKTAEVAETTWAAGDAGDAVEAVTLRDCAKLVRVRIPWETMRDAMLAVAAEVHAS